MIGAAIHGPFGPAGTSGGQFVNNNYKKKRLSKKNPKKNIWTQMPQQG